MGIVSVEAYAECEICMMDVTVQLIEMINGTWGYGEEGLPEGWSALLSYGNSYDFYCPECSGHEINKRILEKDKAITTEVMR